MRNSLKLVLVTLPLALIGVGILAFFVTSKTPPTHEPLGERATTVRVLEVVPLSLTPKIIGYGHVEPATVWTAIAQVGGEVISIAQGLEKGAVLPRGTELLRLSPADFNLAVAEAEANIRAAEARLRELAVATENTQQSLDLERQSLALAEADLQRSQELRDRDVIAPALFDKVAAALVAQRQKLATVENALALFPTQRAVLEEQIALYKVSLKSAQLNLARTTIILPFDARVASVATEVGQYVRQGQTVGVFDEVGGAEIETQLAIGRFRTLLDAAAQEPNATVDLTNFEELAERAGFTAIVRLRMGEEHVEWPGTLARVSAAMDSATGTLGVVVAVADAYGGVRAAQKPPLAKGMFVEVELRTAPIDNAILVPRSAVHGQKIYLVDADNRLAMRIVQTGLAQGDFVVVNSGLAPGERVVVSQLSYAVENMALSPVTDDDLASRILAESIGEVVGQ